MRPVNRRGFLLLTVLWAVSVASAVALGIALNGRSGVGAARNRIAIERAAWAAHGCVAAALASISAQLRDDSDDKALRETWRALRSVVRDNSPPPECEIALASTGERLDVAGASLDQIAALVRATGRATSANALAAAIVAREAQHRDQLATVPALAHQPEVLALLDAGNGPVDLSNAPLPVLAGVVGFTESTAAAVVHWRDEGRDLRDLRSLIPQLPEADASWLSRHVAEAQAMVTFEPRHWRLSATASSGQPAIRRTEEWIVGRSGRDIVPQSRRVW